MAHLATFPSLAPHRNPSLRSAFRHAYPASSSTGLPPLVPQTPTPMMTVGAHPTQYLSYPTSSPTERGRPQERGHHYHINAHHRSHSQSGQRYDFPGQLQYAQASTSGLYATSQAPVRYGYPTEWHSGQTPPPRARSRAPSLHRASYISSPIATAIHSPIQTMAPRYSPPSVTVYHTREASDPNRRKHHRHRSRSRSRHEHSHSGHMHSGAVVYAGCGHNAKPASTSWATRR